MIMAISEPENGYDRVLELPVLDVYPSSENDRLYRPVDPTDPGIIALAESIRAHGIKEPLIVTEDHSIVSGHRRFAAAQVAGLRFVPCRIEPFRKQDDPDRFIQLLRECNRQRVKSLNEKLREELLSTNTQEAYESLVAYRDSQSAVCVDTIDLRETKNRCKISKAKQPMLAAVKKILTARRRQRLLPVSVRKVHYLLLNDPPLKHASKPGSVYANVPADYKNLVDLLARARFAGEIPWDAISDDTRPVSIWQVDQDVEAFMRRSFDTFLKGYWRDLLQSQPNHIEIVAEKSTLAPDLRPVAAKFCLPLTMGRGFSSLPPRYEMAQRFRKSGKERLVVLMVTDFDPDGEEIAHSFATSMRDDFDIKKIEPMKVALTAQQVVDFKLSPNMKAKRTSVNYDRFVGEHGTDVFEVEALETADLQRILEATIDSVIDTETFNYELAQEKRDAAFLDAARQTVYSALRETVFDDLGGRE